MVKVLKIGSVVKNSSARARDVASIPGLGRTPGRGNGNPLQYFCLEIPWTEEPGGLQSTGSTNSQTHPAGTHTGLIPNAVLASGAQRGDAVTQMWASSAAKSRPTLGSHGLRHSRSFTIFPSWLKFTSAELAMLPNHLVLCLPFLLSQHQDLFK